MASSLYVGECDHAEDEPRQRRAGRLSTAHEQVDYGHLDLLTYRHTNHADPGTGGRGQGRQNVFKTTEARCIDVRSRAGGGCHRGPPPSRLSESGGVTPGIFLEILDAKSCIFVHRESLNVLINSR